jgi:hypothetical protein
MKASGLDILRFTRIEVIRAPRNVGREVTAAIASRTIGEFRALRRA